GKADSSMQNDSLSMQNDGLSMQNGTAERSFCTRVQNGNMIRNGLILRLAVHHVKRWGTVQNDPLPKLSIVDWGMIPSRAADPSIRDQMANAQFETAATKPLFRGAFNSRRCLIVADGFCECQKTDRRKRPHFIGMKDGRPFGIAGLWERWEKGEEPVESCAILITG